MSIPLFTDDVNIIGKLNSRPNLRDGLTDEQLKAKFDEAADLIKAYINEKLIPAIAAKNVPFASSDGSVEGETVREALEWLKTQIAQTTLGQIGDSTITAEKLAAAVQNVLNSGIPIVSETTPEDPGEELKLSAGQLWLRTVGGEIADLNILLDDGSWLSFAEPVLPVSKGGTGRERVSGGAILYGNETSGMEQLEAPDTDTSFLSAVGGVPVWKGKERAKSDLGFLTVATGSYNGDESKKEIVLMNGNEEEISPKFLVVYRADGAIDRKDNLASPLIEDTICLCNGAQIGRAVYISGVGEQLVTITLLDGKLIFGNGTNTADTALSPFMNWKDTEYQWMALY